MTMTPLNEDEKKELTSALEELYNWVISIPERQIQWFGSNQFMVFVLVVAIIIQILLAVFLGNHS